MTDVGNDFHLKFALHQPDHEFFVQSVSARQDEQSRCSASQETGREAFEPTYESMSQL